VYNKPGTEHLEVYWDANDTSSYAGSGTTVTDLSGNGVTGTISGTNGFDSEYNAWVFDGSGDYIRSGNIGLSGAQVMSVSFWFRYNSVPTSRQDPFTIGKSGTAVQFGLATYTPGTYLYTGGNDIYMADNIVTDTEWHHVVAIYSGGIPSTTTMSLYVDNVNVVDKLTGSSATQALNLDSADCAVNVGINAGSGGLLNGKISSFRLFTKALSVEQVKELYDYQKDYFLGSRSSMTLYKGNLGLGVAEPTARFEVAGNERIQEYPPRALSGNREGCETYIEGHGVFRAIASSNHGSAGSVPGGFDKKTSSYWHASNATGYLYNGTDGAYGSAGPSSLGGIRGEWLKLEIPYKVKLSSLSILARSGQNPQAPEDFKIIGSNDGSTWEIIQEFFGIARNDSVPVAVPITSNPNAYNSYAIVVQRTGGATGLTIGELRYFGTPAPSTLDDGHMTLGKQLTLPRVSGHAPDAETPRAESLIVHYDTTVDSVKSGSTAVDSSGAGNHGELLNGASYLSEERAFKFVGVDNNNQAANSSDTVRGTHGLSGGAQSIHSQSVWFKQTTDASDYTWICALGTASAGNQSGILLSGSSSYPNRITFDAYNGWVTSTVTAELNRWYHVVVTYKGGGWNTTNCKIYVNGVDCTGPASEVYNASQAISFSGSILALGSTHEGTRGLTGTISNYKLWNVVLTPEEVAMDYALGRTGKALNVPDTAVCIGGIAPRAQLDVRGTGMFDGGLVIKTKDSIEHARNGGITLSRAGFGNSGNQWSSQPIILDGGDTGAIDLNIRGGAIWSQWGGSQYGIAIKGSSAGNAYPYLQSPSFFVTNDKVGIGTVTPHARLQVHGSSGAVTGGGSRKWFTRDTTLSGDGLGSWGAMSIYASNDIVSGGYFAAVNGTIGSSDERIKKNIVDANDSECLETLRLLKPKKYQYRDIVEKGEEPVWGFIAQEVRETLPYATQLRKYVLPNIYELANVSSSNVITFTNFNTSNLESNATTLVRTMGIDGEQHDVHLAEVIDTHTIRVKEDLTDWIGSVDETGNVVAGNQLFVYGQEVDDFLFLKKEAIWTVATAALQEVDRQLQAEKAKVADLLARVTALENA
jgi:hypothetical protein